MYYKIYIMNRTILKTCTNILLMVTLLVCLPLEAKAESFTDDIYRYYITSTTENTVEVAGLADATLDDYVIPETVSYNEVKYTVTGIGNGAFSNCRLSSVILSNNVKTLIGNCFSDCINLKSINLSDNITNIGSGCFSGCSSLSSITIPKNIGTKLTSNCFKNCTSLTSVIIPETITTIGYDCFMGCSGLTTIEIPNSITILEDNVFSGCSQLTSIELPNSVKEIGGGCFKDCSTLKSIKIPDGVKFDPRPLTGFFDNCTSLESIEIPNSVTDLSVFFRGCTSLTSVTIPNSVTIMYESFRDCTSLTSINIPNSVTNIDQAFMGCTNLSSIQIPKSVTSMKGTFSGCTSLTSITLPDQVKSLPSTFSGCSNLVSIIIPDNVTTMSGTFSGCSSLTSITLPNSVTNIDQAFTGCTSLSNIQIPQNVTTMNNTFYYCTALTSITLPDNLKSLSETFSGCSNLVSIHLPDNLIDLGDNTFANCSKLKEIVIPAYVKTIGQSAFYNCIDLSSIRILNPIPPVCNSLISTLDTYNSCKVYVPKGTKAAYQAAKEWKDFKFIIDKSTPEIPDLDIKMITNGFSEYVSIKQKEISGIYFKSSDSSIPVCFRYKLKDPSWKSKMTLLYTPSPSSGATKKPLQFDEQGIAWIDTPEGYEVKDDELANYIIPQFNETGNLDYEITVYDQTKTTAYATFDCSLIVANTVDFTLSEINGAKETEIPFTVTIANAGDFAGKKVKMSIEALGLNKDNTTIRFIDQETTETIPLTDPFGNGTCVNGEHILSNFSATTYHYTFKSTCNLTDVEMSIVFCDTENDWWISSGGKSVKININDQPTGPEDNFTSGLLEYEINGNATVRISGVTDDTKTEYTIPSTVTHNNKTYSVTTIGFEAFQRCENLTRFIAPSSLDTIKGQAFSECPNLKEVLLPEGLRIIESEAFCECTSLVNIDLPASVILIEEATFDSCSKLAKITVKAGSEYYKSVDGVLYDKKMSTLHTYPNKHASTFLIPEEVTQIGDYAFCNCTNLTSVTIHNKVKNMGRGAFEGCSGLKEISLPEGLETTGEGIFDSCTGLKSMSLPTSLKTIGYGMFDNCHETLEELHVKYATPLQLGENPAYTFFGYYGPESEICKLYVPKGSKAAYEKAAGWKEFKHILEEGGTTDDSDKPLTPPNPHADITLSSDSSYTDANGNQGKFNGTIGTGNTETEINTLTINNPTSATIKLNRVVIGDGNTTETAVSVSQNTIVTLQLQRENSLGKVINNGNMTLTGDPSASLIRTAVVNNGIFTDETTFVTQVEGAAALNISAPEDKEITEGKPVTLSASTRVSINYSITFIWEQLQPDGSWKQIESHNTGRSTLRASETEIEDKLTITPDKTCQYRCRIKNQVEDISTTLITQPATVTVNPGDVGNASIETGRTVYVRNGILHIRLATPDQVQIIHLNGTILRSLDLSAGETQITGLSEGVYIIRYRDSKTTKVVI